MSHLTVVVLDTSYVLELYGVPGFHGAAFGAAVKRRMKDGQRRLYLPVAVVYEVGNHIADVPDGALRSRLAGRWRDDVTRSHAEGVPFNLAPADDAAGLVAHLAVWARELAASGIGLVDAAILAESARLSERYSRHPGARVHIWTRDRELKAREPDPETSPLV